MFLLFHVIAMLIITVLYMLFMKTEREQQRKYPTVSKKVTITQLKPMQLNTAKTADMLSRLEHTKEVRKELDAKEDEARALKKWLDEHPEATASERQDRHKQLLAALQSINDLVCQLKPLPVYILR
jgi:hypothetical protein